MKLSRTVPESKPSDVCPVCQNFWELNYCVWTRASCNWVSMNCSHRSLNAHTLTHKHTHTLALFILPSPRLHDPSYFLWSSEHQSLIPQSRNEGKGDDKKRDDRLLAIYRGGFAPLPLFIFSPRPQDTGYTFWFPTMQIDFHTASNIQWFPLNHLGK